MATQDTTSAEKRLQDGIDAFSAGKFETAASAFVEAEKQFRQASDLKRAGDSRSLLADMQRENNLIEQAVTSYRRAINLYKEAG